MPALQPPVAIIYENFILIPQTAADPRLRPVERTADGAFVYPPFLGDLANIHPLKVVGQHCFPLQGRQFLFNHIFYPFELHLPWQAWALVVVKECISHCGSTPFRNNVRSAPPVRSFG